MRVKGFVMNELTRRSTTSPIRNLRREFDRFFEDIIPLRWFDESEEMAEQLWAPRADMSETENEYVINLDLPGVSKKDLRVNMEDNMLTINGERKKDETKKGEGYYRRERAYGNFYRAFTLPKPVKEKDINATFKDGVLTVIIPKSEKSKPKKIEIK